MSELIDIPTTVEHTNRPSLIGKIAKSAFGLVGHEFFKQAAKIDTAEEWISTANNETSKTEPNRRNLRYLLRYSPTDQTSAIFFVKGEIYYALNDFDDAGRLFDLFLDPKKLPISEDEIKAQIMALYYLGNESNDEEKYSKLENRYRNEGEKFPDAYTIIMAINQAKRKNLSGAISTIDHLLNKLIGASPVSKDAINNDQYNKIYWEHISKPRESFKFKIRTCLRLAKNLYDNEQYAHSYPDKSLGLISDFLHWYLEQ